MPTHYILAKPVAGLISSMPGSVLMLPTIKVTWVILPITTTMENGLWMGYNWVKPKNWYNQVRINMNLFHNRLVKPIDALKRSDLMFQNAGFNVNANAQTKKLWWVGFNFNVKADDNDFYEARSAGRVFRNKGSKGMNICLKVIRSKNFHGLQSFCRNRRSV